MGKLDENILYDALKHENIQDHVDLEDEDKEFLENLSKGKVNIDITPLHKRSMSCSSPSANPEQ